MPQSPSQKMPVLFIGHGNPMNAILETPFTQMLNKLGQDLPTPRAIICVSAHWLTEGSRLTHMATPRMIYDFFGFPKELSEVQYPAVGSPEVAELSAAMVSDPKLQLDDATWGLDHGSWAILKHLYPKADIPTIQLSLDHTQPFTYHLELGKQLRSLRDKGVLIVGSGNIVHNLKQINWEREAKAFDWAIEFDEWAKTQLLNRDQDALVFDASKSTAGKLSIPTSDHFLPLLYALGAADDTDELAFEYESIENASISMRCISYGLR